MQKYDTTDCVRKGIFFVSASKCLHKCSRFYPQEEACVFLLRSPAPSCVECRCLCGKTGCIWFDVSTASSTTNVVSLLLFFLLFFIINIMVMIIIIVIAADIIVVVIINIIIFGIFIISPITIIYIIIIMIVVVVAVVGISIDIILVIIIRLLLLKFSVWWFRFIVIIGIRITLAMGNNVSYDGILIKVRTKIR